ncbi:uncharacterized protein BDZ99DRAFT_471946 [Mytilinidion resinicola]|uniref:Uncharacterized protein n=1 Tax=Mytilinidion resinicola TaxID=574789 RepID=A0A6A6Z1C8_9PEZI|nr:uncharacterized protein BDZ99DRAFT_471946 [Mytilinidion resinicola]KAF2814529.1 hypothetical protein BDZ99DRAFT_471946 [Mytilinidion resinicola]
MDLKRKVSVINIPQAVDYVDCSAPPNEAGLPVCLNRPQGGTPGSDGGAGFQTALRTRLRQTAVPQRGEGAYMAEEPDPKAARRVLWKVFMYLCNGEYKAIHPRRQTLQISPTHTGDHVSSAIRACVSRAYRVAVASISQHRGAASAWLSIVKRRGSVVRPGRSQPYQPARWGSRRPPREPLAAPLRWGGRGLILSAIQRHGWGLAAQHLCMRRRSLYGDAEPHPRPKYPQTGASPSLAQPAAREERAACRCCAEATHGAPIRFPCRLSTKRQKTPSGAAPLSSFSPPD